MTETMIAMHDVVKELSSSITETAKARSLHDGDERQHKRIVTLETLVRMRSMFPDNDSEIAAFLDGEMRSLMDMQYVLEKNSLVPEK